MLSRLRSEGGFALPTVLVLLLVGSLFAVASWGATRGDISQTGNDRNSKQALAAAESGIEFYRYMLSLNNSYWSLCDQVNPSPPPANPAPVSQPGAPAATITWRTIPGGTAQYRLELVPQNGFTQCQTGNALSMIDASTGTLQIRAIGKSGHETRTVVATLRHKGFLDFLYFTDLETEDPTIYQSTSPTGNTPGTYPYADQNCRVWRRTPRAAGCSKIVFGPNDALHGPMHTNDDLLVCGGPVFGRDPSTQGGKIDSIEISGGGTASPAAGWADGGCGLGANPTFWGAPQQPQTKAQIIGMPSTNSQLSSVAASQWTFTGVTRIDVSGSSMTVKDRNNNVLRTGWPPNGVVYIKNGTCTGTYDFYQKYDTPTVEPGCAETYVRGTNYQKSFTIASANDIVVDGPITRDSTANAVGGLIADGFVRVYHPVDRTQSPCKNVTTGSPGWNGVGVGGRDLGSVQIDAAILSVNHQFRVDNYDCGSPEGTLTVNGAIAQKFRGTVGVVGSSGYVKNYNYDDRLKNISPPYFLDPLVSEWRVVRYNEQLPNRP
jgi:hypothetical protein